MTQKERMLKGLIYDPSDEELLALRKKSHKLCLEYNNTTEDDFIKRDAISDYDSKHKK